MSKQTSGRDNRQENVRVDCMCGLGRRETWTQMKETGDNRDNVLHVRTSRNDMNLSYGDICFYCTTSWQLHFLYFTQL